MTDIRYLPGTPLYEQRRATESTHMSKLEAIFDHLLTRASATGRDQHADLPGGARLAVRVAGGQTVVSVARSPQRVGDTEAVTFKRICRVPDGARRIPADGQAERVVSGKMWNMIGWVWGEEETSP